MENTRMRKRLPALVCTVLALVIMMSAFLTVFAADNKLSEAVLDLNAITVQDDQQPRCLSLDEDDYKITEFYWTQDDGTVFGNKYDSKAKAVKTYAGFKTFQSGHTYNMTIVVTAKNGNKFDKEAKANISNWNYPANALTATVSSDGKTMTITAKGISPKDDKVIVAASVNSITLKKGNKGLVAEPRADGTIYTYGDALTKQLSGTISLAIDGKTIIDNVKLSDLSNCVYNGVKADVTVTSLFDMDLLPFGVYACTAHFNGWKNALGLDVTADFLVTVTSGLPYEDWFMGATKFRAYGDNKYGTSLAAADMYLEILKDNCNLLKFNNVIITTGRDYADALSASALAAQKYAPIILVDTKNGKQISQDVVNYVKDNLQILGSVYIIGGPDAVSYEAENALKQACGNINVYRNPGNTRYDTNLSILNKVGVFGKEVLVCSANNYPDALTAAATGKPILLADNKTGKLNQDQKDFLKNCGAASYTVIGGKSAVPDSIIQDLKAVTGKTARRINAANKQDDHRYGTSKKVAETYFKTTDLAFLVTGEDFPDALCAGPIAHQLGAPILLVSNHESGFKYARDYINATNVKYAIVLGGQGAVADATVNAVLKDGHNQITTKYFTF